MAFRFSKSSCVAVGTFNMYIIQPAWLGRVGIIPDGIRMSIEGNLEEPGLRFTSPELKSKWSMTPARLQVEAQDASEDCGRLVAMVLRQLPWTPLAGVGNNATYVAGPEESARLAKGLHALQESPRPAGYEFHLATYQLSLRHDAQIVNLQMAFGVEEITLSTNVHTPLRGKGGEEAWKAADAFLEHRRMAEKLCQESLGVEFGDDRGNA